MKRRVFFLGLWAVLIGVVVEVTFTVLVLPNPLLIWRPQPPFGALTNDAQRAWLERRQTELAEGPEVLGLGQFDPDLGWTLRPGASSADGRFNVNGGGLRGRRSYASEAPAGTLRIVACGDSYTFCDEVADDEAWPALIEASWPAAEVMNYGVGGYGTDQALLRFRALDPGPRVDALLVGLLLDDVGRNVNRYRPRYYPLATSPAAKPRFLLRDGELELLPQPFQTDAELVAAVATGGILSQLEEGEYWSRRWVPRWLSWSAIARLFGGRKAYAARALPRQYGDVDDEPFRVTLALLEAFERESRAHGAPLFLVLIFPSERELRGLVETDERFWSTLTTALAERGIEYIDLSEPLSAVLRPGHGAMTTLYRGSHLSPAGNAAVAESVRAYLQSRL